MGKENNQVDNRRVFINKGQDYYQIFSFTQHKDGSIYCGLPEFPEIVWMSIQNEGGTPGLIIVDPLAEDGKLSIHGSGMTTHRPHKDTKGHRLVVNGNYLKTTDDNKYGVRHLFSCFLQEPRHIPTNSPAFNRKTDYVLNNIEPTKPFTMVFFAVPGLSNFQVRIDASFHIDEVTKLPPEASFGNFSLLYHNIVWFYYRTTHMEHWPVQSRICYYDGFKVPMFIGESQDSNIKEAKCKLEIRHPDYKLEENMLKVYLPR